MTLVANDFQQGIKEVRERVLGLIGKRITGDKDHMFTGCWDGPQRVSGVIKYVLHDGCFVAGVQFDGEDVSTLNAGSFMLNTTSWDWDDPAARDDDMLIPKGVKHERSMHRAYCLMITIADRVGFDGLKGKYIIILDGNGENRRAIENALDDIGVPIVDRPTVITLELNANVAFANALRFGREHVRLTSGDFRMQHKRNDVCGIERAILLKGHSILSEEEKLNCLGLYLDYCGSPSKLTNFDKLYAALPQLVACAVTVAKRQPNNAFTCRKRRQLAAPPLDQFALLHTFDHDKVFCDMYGRLPVKEQGGSALAESYTKEHTDERAVRPPKSVRVRRNKVASRRHKQARRLVGVDVAIPLHFWPDSQPGPGFVDVQRQDDRLLFRVTKTLYKQNCALRAIMTNGSLHPATEGFWLTPEQAAALALVAPKKMKSVPKSR